MTTNTAIKLVDKNQTLDEALSAAIEQGASEYGRPMPTFYKTMKLEQQKSKMNEEELKMLEKKVENRNAYSDLLYGWLLSNGIYNQEKGYYYIPKTTASANKISKQINLSRPTVTTKMNAMLGNGMLVESGDYYHIPTPKEDYFIIDQNTLDFLLASCKEDVIKIYSAIGNRWNAKQNLELKGCYVSLNKLATQIGLTNTGPNLKKVKNIMLALNLFGLIDWQEETYNDMEVMNITVFNNTVEGKRKLEQR